MTAATPTPAPTPEPELSAVFAEFVAQLETLGVPAASMVPYVIDLTALTAVAYERGRNSALALSGAAS